MSRFSETLSASHVLSLTAMEEASRFGLRTADLAHLLIALTLDEGVAGQTLRLHAVTLEAVRDAVSAEDQEQLASLGITAAPPAPGEIVFHSTGGYEWSDRALAVLRKADTKPAGSYPVQVLHQLLSEPSGAPQALIRRTGADPEAVRESLVFAEQHFSQQKPPRIDVRNLSGTTQAFIPASPSHVWRALSQPDQIARWQEHLTELAPEPDTPGQWIAQTVETLPNGKPHRVKPHLAHQTVTLVDCEPEHTVTWRFTFPEAPKSNARRVTFQLAPAAAGTTVAITHTWERSRRRKLPFIGWLMRPLYRFAIWMQVTTLATSISRMFRSTTS